jgi:hypothetical protein
MFLEDKILRIANQKIHDHYEIHQIGGSDLSEFVDSVIASGAEVE